MYLRRCYRRKDGKRHAYWALVESYRTNRGPRQRVVAWLGVMDEQGRLGVKRCAEKRPGYQTDLFRSTEPEWVEVDVKRVRVERSRKFGGPWLGKELLRRLALDEFLEQTLPNGREEIPWSATAMILLLTRLCEPSSELHVAEHVYQASALSDLLGIPDEKVNEDRLYRALDTLLPHKKALEKHLKERLGELFDLDYDLLLYDITSTYFEGAGPANFAKHGHSRDGKPHNVQVIVAVVMVAGWPIAHHVWAGNEVDHTTVGKAIADLHQRFGFNRLVFVGDRGMVTSNNLDAITAGNHGYLVGLKRRRNKKLDKWLAAVDEAKWINCPVGVTAREKVDPPRTRAQEVPSGIAGMRVIIVDSDERRAYEEAMRVKSMERTRQALEKLRLRIAAGKLKQPEKIGAAAERLLQRSHGYRYYSWEIHQGGFRYFENAAGLGSEKGIEGKYVIATSESGLSVLEVVAIYKDLSDVERGFRQLKDVLAMRPIYHQIEARVKAHIFVAALALLVQRLLDRRLEEAGINFSAERAMEALQTVRLVTFRMDNRPERRGVSGGCPDARRVLKALKLTELKPPTPPEGEETVM